MTEPEIQAAIHEISRYAEEGDFEAAHILEDQLHYRIMAWIASGGCADPVSAAKYALRTCKISFQRRVG